MNSKESKLKTNRTLSDIYTADFAAYHSKDREELMARHMDDFFWKAFYMCSINRIEGDYLEFGCGSNSRSFRLAWKYKQLEHFSGRLLAFDSFKGLPEPKGIDNYLPWHKGAMAIEYEKFVELMRLYGAENKRDYRLIEGYYEKTLDKKKPSDYGIEKAAIIYVDCDYYYSTVPVLKFIKEALTDGTIIAFDDWFIFKGNPDYGEQRAFNEWLRENQDLQFTEYLNIGWHGKAFICNLI
jgi:hypothetical protein